MILPEFREHRVAQVAESLLRAWGGAAQAKDLEAALRAVTDPADYLRRVADRGPEAARCLVTAAVLGMAVAVAMQELTQAKE